MIQRINDLEKEITDVKAWQAEKQRYQLITPWDGCHVYALKDASKGTDPPHWICHIVLRTGESRSCITLISTTDEPAL